MKGMPEEEVFFRMMANFGLYTNTLGEVQEVQRGRYCKIKLISGTQEDKEIPVINVPVGRWIGTSSPVQPGMIIPIYFSKWALGQYFAETNRDYTMESPIKELQFTRNDAYAVPIVFDDMLDTEFPEEIRFHEKPIFEEGAKFLKTSEFREDVTVTNKVTASEVDGTTSVTSAGLNFNIHVHGGVESGPNDTQGPK